MAKFKYSMQNILNLKLKLEDQARIEFAAARAELDRREAHLQELRDRREGYVSEKRECMSGSLDFVKLEEISSAIVVMDNYIMSAINDVRSAEKILERERKKLTEAMQERKVQEKLREKAFNEFMLEENRAESKVIDERNSYTYSAKR